jgi:hypothetical protein
MRSNPEHSRTTYRCSSRETASGACGGKRVPGDQVEAEVWLALTSLWRKPAVLIDGLLNAGPDPLLLAQLETSASAPQTWSTSRNGYSARMPGAATRSPGDWSNSRSTNLRSTCKARPYGSRTLRRDRPTNRRWNSATCWSGSWPCTTGTGVNGAFRPSAEPWNSWTYRCSPMVTTGPWRAVLPTTRPWGHTPTPTLSRTRSRTHAV